MKFIDKPTTDFAAVRDGRRSMPLWLDVDLSTARSISAGNAQVINIAGNSFYVDADTINVGIATLHFQDTNLGNSSAPMTAAPGFVANVPFTQILVENTAQAGKRLRIFYGVDIDFRAGVNASVISGVVQVSGLIPAAPVSFAKSNTALVAVTPEQVFAAGANVNGAIIWDAAFTSANAVGIPLVSLLAKSTAPASAIDGNLILSTDNGSFGNATYYGFGSTKQGTKIAAGLGLYWIATNSESAGMRRCNYTLL